MGKDTKKKKSNFISTGKGGEKKSQAAKAAAGSSGSARKRLPRTVQDTLDWICTYENGVFQIGPKKFSKTWAFDDISFKTKSDEDQVAICEAYKRFLNKMSPSQEMYITFVNYKENESDKLATVLPPMKGDAMDVYRGEIAGVLKENMKLSRNSISTARYITMTLEADSVEAAMKEFASLDGELESDFRKIAGTPARPLDLAQRLEVLNGILNSDEKNYWFEHDKDGGVHVDFDRMRHQGLTTKDIIAPEAMRFYSNRFEIGERLGQVLYLDSIANWMDTDFLPSLTSVSFEAVFNIHITVMEQGEAIKLVNRQTVTVEAEIEQKQDDRAGKGKNPERINPELRKRSEELELLSDDIVNRDQRLFYMSMTMCHFADDADTLDEQKKILIQSGDKYMAKIRPLLQWQERGFNTSLPIGNDKCFTNRVLTTESLAVFLPFDEANQFDVGGIYYGVNSINKSLIVYDRTKAMNYNGLILGQSGSGKSFSAKREMISVILNKDADIYIIDPDGEYTPLADAFGGEVIKIAPGNGIYINPFDLDIDNSYDKDLNPVAMKTDFICGMLETMIGPGARLDPIQKSIVDRCVQQMYAPYLEHLAELPMDSDGRRRTIDKGYCPTMQNLFDTLLGQPQPEAQMLALIMETYTTGAFDTFAHRTNVDTDSRLIVYDISSIGTNLMELGLKVCTNDMWNRMMANRKRGRWTWMYIDEFHRLLANPSTAEFIKNIWKRARKFSGVPTGITQNMEELLNSGEAKAVINNTSFVYMLSLSLIDRNILQEILSLTDGDMAYVTNSEPGHGLIYTTSQVLPFQDDFPEDTKLYQIMTTKPTDEARQIEKEEETDE